MNRSSRLLVPITYGFSVRYLLPTGALDRLGEVSTPVVGLGWEDPALQDLLTDKGIEVVRLPTPTLSHDYRMFRRRLALLHEQRLNSVTTAIKRRNPVDRDPSAVLRALTRTRRILDGVALRSPSGVATAEAAEPAAVATGTNIREFSDLLSRNRIDAVMSLAPYHDQEGLLLWAARELGIPSVTSVISFDNPTTRSRWMSRSDLVLVWNSYNADEVTRSYPDLTAERVSVIGAPQFDLHRRPDLVMDEDEWRKDLDIAKDRPVILYGAGPGVLVPGEARLVKGIDQAITAGRIPGSPLLVVRRHPNDRPEPWHELGRHLDNSRIVDPWPPGKSTFQSWPSHDDLVRQMSSLAHSNVHVNVCSSMTLDGAMFDRAQVGPRFVPDAGRTTQRRIRTFYKQEHWQPIANSGGLACADNQAELIAAISDGIENPDRLSGQRKEMISAVLTWDDGRSSQRLADSVAQLGAR